ncbi:hypothetical protein QBC42DRAFT_152903, partial [Cladorrhinum samala]
TAAASFAVAVPADDRRPCGLKIAPCPTGYVCHFTDAACTDENRCLGTCTRRVPLPTPTPTKTPTPKPTYQPCGGFRVTPLECPKGQICVDDPRVSGCGMACDRPGICVTPEFCGGFAGIPCKDKNKVCIDDPRDDCDPMHGGADCGGICV